MKNFIINNCMSYIRNNTGFNEIKFKEIEYGLVSIYLLISKIIVISFISIILGIFKEMIIFSLIYNIIRIPSFGIHANKSWVCWIVSTIIFIGIPLLCLYLRINMYIKVIICVLCIILMFKNAPADTKKRPIVSKKRRKIYKTISTLLSIIFSAGCVLINNQFISNCLISALMLQNILISPLTYKLFKLPYNNYITYLENHREFAQ